MPTSTAAVPAETLLQQLNWRYATKKFDPAIKIPAAQWKSLEEVLRLSPSSFGLQPWKFFVIDNPETRQQLRAASFGQSQITDASHLVVFAVKKNFGVPDAEKLLQHTADIRKVPLASLDGYKQFMVGFIERLTPEQRLAWASRQVYIALGTFLTAAAVLGIDACPMEGIMPADYDRILGLEAQGYTALFVATAGARAADDPYATLAKVRYPTDHVVTHV